MSIHPFRRMSEDEMQGRGLCDIQDPNATLPQKCSQCGEASSFRNPLMMSPVDPNPKALSKAYLYKAVCAHCREQSRRRR